MYKLRKKYQRKFNKMVKALNENIKNDSLWLGRFEFRQKDCYYDEFRDGSGAMLYIFIRGYDKQTGYYKDFKIEYAPWLMSAGYHLWEMANKFIVEDAGVWGQKERPALGKTANYQKIKMPHSIMIEPYNFYDKYMMVKKIF